MLSLQQEKKTNANSRRRKNCDFSIFQEIGIPLEFQQKNVIILFFFSNVFACSLVGCTTRIDDNTNIDREIKKKTNFSLVWHSIVIRYSESFIYCLSAKRILDTRWDYCTSINRLSLVVFCGCAVEMHFGQFKERQKEIQ